MGRLDYMLVPHLHRIDPEASSLRPKIESVKDDNGLRDDLLRQPEQYAGSLGEFRAGEAKRTLEIRRYAIKLGAGGRELVDRSQRV